ncbi:beta-lactamase-like protein [Xylogone sp. PMI_703]|nr:beta-lactamase-like protein [Xylogone sp. PMI_703]
MAYFSVSSLVLAATLATLPIASAFPRTPVVPTYAPVPAIAVGPPVSTKLGYRIESFGGGAFMVTDGMYQAMFLVSTESVIVVDAPPTIGTNLVHAIKATTHLPISHVVYSHAHADHIGAAYLYGSHVITIAHRMTAELLRDESVDKSRPAPTLTFDETFELHVHNQTLRLAYLGPNHEPGNIFIYAPKQKVLMLVDVVFPGWVPFAYLGEAQNVPGYIKAHDDILGYDFEHFVGGHLTRSGTRQDVITQKEYVEDLRNNCAQALALSGSPSNKTNPVSAETLIPEAYAADPGNPWATFKIYLDEVTNYCANVTNEKWLGRLGGADVYGYENAYQMLESLRIDYNELGPFGVS